MPFSNFTNVGSLVTQQLQELLAQREAERQREFLNALATRKQDLDEQQERRIADFQQQQFKDQAFNREDVRVDRMHEDAMPQDIVSEADAELYRKHGRGGALRSSGAGMEAEAGLTPDGVNVNLQGDVTPAQMAALDAELTGSVDDLKSTQTRAAVAPGIIYHRGGTKYLSDQKARDDRAERERENERIRAEARKDTAEARAHQSQLQREATAANQQANRDAQAAGRTAGRADRLASAYERSPIVRKVNTMAEQFDFVSNIPNNTQNPADDQAIIYAFAKMMDPESVVREGEYATAKKYVQSLPQSIRAEFMNAIAGTGFLSQTARENIKIVMGDRYRAARVPYDNYRAETIRKINHATGDDDGETYISGFENAYPTAPQVRPAASHAPTGGSNIKSIRRIP